MNKTKKENIIAIILGIAAIFIMWWLAQNLRSRLPYEDVSCPKCGYHMMYRLDDPTRPEETIYKCNNCKSEMTVVENVPEHAVEDY